ncbi:hypothetical protein [Eleftheria terrae]|uniref:hypothetical protein n=1 Tax=Eleftheria terrae TaxID=1597781 RepID=UPI00263B0ACA|nr:hypothetical protein [Eleftheria terrae]WKB53698.1 hypothetical protein N7L95_04710 [Eleftheria terrae]
MRRSLVSFFIAVPLLGACSSVGVGLSVPVGFGGVGVSIGSDGRIGGTVGVGRGGVGVGIGGTTRLPAAAEAPQSAASQPAAAASSASGGAAR